jgi:hypothetical protein
LKVETVLATRIHSLAYAASSASCWQGAQTSDDNRLDEEALTMLDALMQDEDRSSQREMVRVYIKRAYRALVARPFPKTRDQTIPHASVFIVIPFEY